VRAEANLQKTEQCALLAVSYENGHGQGAGRAIAQEGVEFLAVLFDRTLRPKRRPQLRHFVAI
jgi:hypothetical protein